MTSSRRTIRPGRRRALAGLIPALLLGACAVNPVTGERELALISEQQEIAMGREAAGQVRASLGLVDDDELTAYVEEVGLEMARDSERPGLPWEFRVVDDPTPNAFALPGGYIFLTRGMLALMSSEAEMAAVLGHEIGHVTARHSVNQLSRAQLAQVGAAVGMIMVPELRSYGDLVNTGLGLLFLKYGRDDERQADELGFRYMVAHDYEPREMVDVFAALEAYGELQGQGRVPSWFATHPSPPERIAAVRQRVAELAEGKPTGTVEAARFLSHLDGLAYGTDPREGYFTEDTYYHPELAFRFTVPEAWQKQNLKSAVAASSPDQRAALRLTLAEGGASAAAQEFLRSEGVTELATRREQGQGFDSVVSEFRAETRQGRVHGIVAHIDYGQNTYRLLTFAADSAFDAQAGLLRDIATSFRPVSDPEVLDVQALRIEIVTLDREMSLEDFNRRYPSKLPLRELAVINQVPDASSILAAGSRVKRVR